MIEMTIGLRKEMKIDSTLPKENRGYNSLAYWEERFSHELAYDWLLSYDQVAHRLSKYLTQTSRILVVGCGNAPFSIDLYDAGYKNIVNVDYSPTVIHKMLRQYGNSRPEMEWLVMDMTQLTFEDASFDIVIDKSVFDAMLADEGDVWNPNQQSIEKAHEACRSISRVLRPDGGIFFQVSLAQPHFRKKYLLDWHKCKPIEERHELYSASFGWSLEVQHAGNDECSFNHFLYIMKRQVGGQRK